MTDRISEIKERRAKASPGEWIVAGRGNTVPSLAVVVNGTEENIASCIRPKTGNADFIAHAPADIDYLLSELANRDAEIERLREAQRWIPVSEKLPNTERPVQVYMPELYMSVQTGFYTQYYGEDDGKWYEHWIATGNVTHWRELPAPPANGGGKE